MRFVLGNAVGALCGRGDRSDELADLDWAEGRAVPNAAGIEFDAPEITDLHGGCPRIDVQQIPGHERARSSSWQSLARGTGAIETDYRNGEITLLGRLHGAPAPVNSAVCQLAERHAREGRPPGELNPDEVLAVAA